MLDVEQGIARLMGNQEVYFKALKRFAAYAGAARAITAQLAAGDLAAASLTAHTLKGAASLLCALEVHAIAMEVEAALAQGRTPLPMMDDLEAALQRVRERIDVTLPTERAAPATFVPPQPIGNMRELFDRLHALLDEGNAMAIDMLDQYETVLEKALGSAAWRLVAAAAREEDFERALAALRVARPALRY
ncbi:Hpt domain-containing protein [Massilia sp. METH4]|uniref:Hpt domain-containing protein n=1 Tax=Massilia sp. METH4 TaxID=3123041 RepID=UPI0030CB112C